MKKPLKIIWIFIFLFIVAEISCRVLMPSPVRIIDNKTQKRIWLSDTVESSQDGKRFKPNLDLTIYNVWLSLKPKIVLKTNSLGFRDEEIDLRNLNNEYRILVIGDSITWAGYLSLEETYVFQLQKLLNSSIKNKVRTINAGVGDVGIIEEVNLLKENVDKLKPKVVILAFYLNDSRPPWGFESEKRLGWAMLLQKSRFIGFLYENLQMKMYLMRSGILGKSYRFRWFYLSMNPKWKYDRQYFSKIVKEADLDWGAAWQEDSWKVVEQKINEIKRLSIEKGFKFIIVCLPVSFQVYTEFIDDFPQRHLVSIAGKEGISFIDMLPVFRKNNDKPLFYDHCHLNEEGQHLVAEELSEYIILHKLL